MRASGRGGSDVLSADKRARELGHAKAQDECQQRSCHVASGAAIVTVTHSGSGLRHRAALGSTRPSPPQTPFLCTSTRLRSFSRARPPLPASPLSCSLPRCDPLHPAR
eukprot:518448-Rhodomonas_salina.3